MLSVLKLISEYLKPAPRSVAVLQEIDRNETIGFEPRYGLGCDAVGERKLFAELFDAYATRNLDPLEYCLLSAAFSIKFRRRDFFVGGSLGSKAQAFAKAGSVGNCFGNFHPNEGVAALRAAIVNPPWEGIHVSAVSKGEVGSHHPPSFDARLDEYRGLGKSGNYSVAPKEGVALDESPGGKVGNKGATLARRDSLCPEV